MEPVERFVQRNQSPFDTVYLDPPFDYAYKHDLLLRLGNSATLHDETRVLIHAPVSEDLPEDISSTPALVRYDQRDYGGSRVHFYRRTAAVQTDDARPDETGMDEPRAAST
jgi:16S rRNA G966 N2-methylase RsmD